MVWVKLVNEEKRRDVLFKKKSLRDRKETILEDSIWRERKMRWKLEWIERERRKRMETGCG